MSEKKTKIGGQAVLEGVMMRGRNAAALAVRDAESNILLETKRLPEMKRVSKTPFIRGVVNMVANFKNGMGYTMRSAEIWGEEEVVEDTKKSKAQIGMATTLGMILGIVLAVGLFMFLPEYLTRLLFNVFSGNVRTSSAGAFFSSLFSEDKLSFSVYMNLVWNLTAGLVKIGIFVSYLSIVTLMKDIRRLFQYHGAEHRTINCYEKGLPLTVSNVQGCSTYHDRCGTAFIFFVILISILCTSIVQIWLKDMNTVYRVLLRLALLLPVVSLSYELIMFNARHDWIILKPLKALGRAMQMLSTRKPDDSMAEVAIASFNAVLAMESDASVEAVSFPAMTTLGEYRRNAAARLADNGVDDSAAIDWVLCRVLQKKRGELKDSFGLGYGVQLKCGKLIDRLAAGEPLQYILGVQQFFEYEFDVNPDVLIPRPETELLTEEVIKSVKKGDRILDLCCGCGAIGVTVSLKTGASVVCSDISEGAVLTAQKNAAKLKSNAETVKSDMFNGISGRFDCIVSNPPYIPSADLDSLDKNVRREPVGALDGGVDGLDYYRIIASVAPQYLKPGGKLFLEVGISQAQAVTELLTAFDCLVKEDYNGVSRIVCGTLKV